MTMEGPDGVFPALLDGVASFRQRLEGTGVTGGQYRERILLLEKDGVVPAVVKAILETLGEILAWLHQAIDTIDEFIVQADAALSVLQTVAVGLAALGKAFDGQWPEGLAAASPVAAALGDVDGVLAEVGDIELPAIIPRPATLAALQVETRALLGRHVDSADPATGSLYELISEVSNFKDGSN